MLIGPPRRKWLLGLIGIFAFALMLRESPVRTYIARHGSSGISDDVPFYSRPNGVYPPEKPLVEVTGVIVKPKPEPNRDGSMPPEEEEAVAKEEEQKEDKATEEKDEEEGKKPESEDKEEGKNPEPEGKEEEKQEESKEGKEEEKEEVEKEYVHPLEPGEASDEDPEDILFEDRPDSDFKDLNDEEYMAVALNYDRPDTDDSHWLKYSYYVGRDYDPRRWEGFRMRNEFVENNGMELIAKENPENPSPTPYLPYPDYNGEKWRKTWKGEFVPCMGPRDRRLNDSDDDIVRALPAQPKGFPHSDVGSFEALGMDGSACFDRYGRYGPYGLGQDDDNVDSWVKPKVNVDWDAIKWGKLQDRCLEDNKERFRPEAREPPNRKPGTDLPKEDGDGKEPSQKSDTRVEPGNLDNDPWAKKPPVRSRWNRREATPKPDDQAGVKDLRYRSRTAVLIRAYEGYKFAPNDIMAVRAMITELSLLSGGEYQVFVLFEVKKSGYIVFENDANYEKFMNDHVPEELRDISLLWHENIFHKWYPKVGDWQVYWHQFMCVQWFAKTHPEFDYFWNWEVDARYTGQHYQFLEEVAKFAREQPRKHLWERNKRYYLPAAHGSWGDFKQSTEEAIVKGVDKGDHPTPIWGPPDQPFIKDFKPIGPKPPGPQDDDSFTWGIGEEADFITLLPIWDPVGTGWSFTRMIWNFVPDVVPIFSPEDPMADRFDHPDFPKVPRRAYINTQLRLSRRLIDTMHSENQAGRSMQAEMWPSSVALHHGLKAVYAPHPIWFDRKWPARYADLIYNADNGKSGRWTEESNSPYNHDREWNFAGWSWYYASRLPRVLYRRWLGWEAEEWKYKKGNIRINGEKQEEEAGIGRMCLPAMLMHPLKGMAKDNM